MIKFTWFHHVLVEYLVWICRREKRRESGMNKKTLFIIGILTTLVAYKGIEELNQLDLSDPFDFEDDERDI
jgi:hypothetical protein